MATFKLVPEPEQIVAVPDRTEAEAGILTVTVALPVISADSAEHLVSLRAVTVYVFVDVGNTENL